jgi:hypothetical protein
MIRHEMLRIGKQLWAKLLYPAKKCGGKEVLVEVLMIVISLSLVMLFKTQILSMANEVFTYCSTFISSNFSGEVS